MKQILITIFMMLSVFVLHAQQVAENNINGFEVKVNYNSLKTSEAPLSVGKLSINKKAKLGLNGENTLESGTYHLAIIEKEGAYYFSLQHGKSAKKVELAIPADNSTTIVQQDKLLVNINEPIPENGMGILQVSWQTHSVQLYLNPVTE